MASRLVLLIQEKMARLTVSERKIAEVILNNQGIIETHTATELAAMAGVSKATCARFFRTLGYADFEEVRLQARDERNRTQPYRPAEDGAERVILGRAISDHLELELRNITRSFEELRSDVLQEVVQMVEEAPRVWFLGFGAEDGVARLGRAIFSRVRHDVHYFSGIGEDWSSDLAMTGPRDVLMLLTLEPRPKILRSILSSARTSRMRIVTLTDHAYRGQAERYSDAVLPCHVANYGIVPTHATMLTLLRLITITYASQNADAVRRRAEMLDSIQEELDMME
ncbi:MurR/RpiR family transcriptional regulator [Solirhodobacter olei]|uniref:MurR/RpiR family transcriptional regulator n=1 Tax=Solirhodobacter olei TaxID=2493082 RepID=UPI000FD94C7E|nr:MurR/RpiR family transcriptional regulator [Solirhodobacter olei]